MKLLAKTVEPDCDWITQGKEYNVVEIGYLMNMTRLATIIDDRSLKTLVFIEDDHLNEYVDWEINEL